MNMVIGGKSNWIGHPELAYIWKSGNWYPFAEVGTPDYVWCEVLVKDLHKLEPTQERQP